MRYTISLGTFIPVAIIAIVAIVAAIPASAATITVTNFSDGSLLRLAGNGHCDLREAIEAANTNAAVDECPAGDVGLDTIAFNIGGGGLQTIRPATPLPIISEPAILDGTTQPGCDGGQCIEIDGRLTSCCAGFRVTANGCTIRGFVINRFYGYAIVIAYGGGNTVEGNFFGTDTNGSVSQGNLGGIHIYESSGNTIGGLTLATGNIISGSNLYSIGGEGILIEGTNATLNKILGNFIGTDATGSEPMGNRVGVEIDGASDNTIGGSAPGAPNVISANSRAGIRIKGADANGNRIVSNSIFANDGMGIDLGGDSQPATNDPGDIDSGPNNFQNYPVMTQAETTGASLLIACELNSAPDTTFELHFYSNPEADSSGFGEGKTFLFEHVVQTGHQGEVNFIMALTQEVTAGEYITVTATDPEGNTSEFSPAIVVVQGSVATQHRELGLKKRRAPRRGQGQ